jgi:hypothetical protein
MMDSAGLQALLDKQAIHEVLLRYCRGIDRCDEELVRSAYHPDATDDHGIYRGGVDGFVAWVIPGLRETYAGTSHVLGNVLVELDGDVAHSEAYVTAWHLFTKDGADHNWIFSGRYVDRFERREGAWKIARRVTICDWEQLTPWRRGEVVPAGTFTAGSRSREDPVYDR